MYCTYDCAHTHTSTSPPSIVTASPSTSTHINGSLATCPFTATLRFFIADQAMEREHSPSFDSARCSCTRRLRTASQFTPSLTFYHLLYSPFIIIRLQISLIFRLLTVYCLTSASRSHGDSASSFLSACRQSMTGSVSLSHTLTLSVIAPGTDTAAAACTASGRRDGHQVEQECPDRHPRKVFHELLIDWSWKFHGLLPLILRFWEQLAWGRFLQYIFLNNLRK